MRCLHTARGDRQGSLHWIPHEQTQDPVERSEFESPRLQNGISILVSENLVIRMRAFLLKCQAMLILT